MPCRGPEPEEYLGEQIRQLQSANDQLEGMLCEALQLLEESFPDVAEMKQVLAKRDPRLLRFMQQHEGAEAAKVRQDAAKKLTARERRLLKIDDQGNPTRK